MKTMKRLLAALLCTMVLLSLAACSQQPKTSDGTQSGKAKYEIGISLFYRRDEFYKDLETGMLETAKELGVTLTIQDADTDAAKQADQIETFTASKMDAVGAAFCDPSGLIPTVKTTVDAGIPVFGFDGGTTDNEGLTSFIGMDNYQAGVIAGEWVKEYVTANLGGSAKIVILDYPPSAVVCAARVEGFKSIIASMSGVEIVAQQDGKASRTDSMTVMENILQANEKVDVVFGINDDTCFGAIAALEAAQRKDVAVISVGWSKEMFEMLENKNEYFKASAVQNPAVMGSTTIKAIVQYLDTGSVDAEILDKAVLVTQDSIKDYDWRSVVEKRAS